jgi:lipoprotein-anchoring transpeptidase ErfK/SrfK
MGILSRLLGVLFFVFFIPLTAFALPKQIDPRGEKMVLVDPVEHAWGAYDANGTLIRSGLASAGANWCHDMQSECHTVTGSYRIRSLGSSNCKSPSFPLPKGGAPMPYCMYFTKYQALHGSNEVVPGNISHGCVRMHVSDARWLRYNFVEQGTLVVIEPY